MKHYHVLHFDAEGKEVLRSLGISYGYALDELWMSRECHPDGKHAIRMCEEASCG